MARTVHGCALTACCSDSASPMRPGCAPPQDQQTLSQELPNILNATSRGAPSGQAVAIPLHSRPGARRAGQREPRGQPAAMVDGRQRADVAIDHATLLAGGMWASVWSRCGAGREPLSGRMVTRSSSHLHLIELTLVWPCTRNLSFSSSSFVHGPTLSLAMASTLPKRRAKDRPSPAPSGSGAAKWETLGAIW